MYMYMSYHAIKLKSCNFCKFPIKIVSTKRLLYVICKILVKEILDTSITYVNRVGVSNANIYSRRVNGAHK
jgi:hypothetical protein